MDSGNVQRVVLLGYRRVRDRFGDTNVINGVAVWTMKELWTTRNSLARRPCSFDGKSSQVKVPEGPTGHKPET